MTASSNPFDDPVFETATEDTDQSDEDKAFSTTPAEASWQYLGDLPYRRIPIYSHVQWQSSCPSSMQQNCLAWYPQGLSKPQHLVDPKEIRNWYQTTTQTHVKACPHGGPIATCTVPLTDAFRVTQLRILTNAGQILSQQEFPPVDFQERYGAVDVLCLGFTSRTTLVVVLSDSLCFTYNLKGEALLKPFYICQESIPLLQAEVYEGGVAVLTKNQDAAIAELLDHHDEQEYSQMAHLTARKIESDDLSHYALVTLLPTSEHANRNFCSFVTLSVLSRLRTSSQHPEVFLSTSDNSVVIVEVSTLKITDVDCRARLSSPIVDMVFAPNGRFLACFTESSILTVISTSFETKVLDFDTSEGSQQVPSQMEWCGEDSVVLHWKGLGVLMVGPYGDWLRFPYEDDTVYILPEIDCCRVITDSAVEILQRVPPVTAQMLSIGSIETSAMLVDASDAFHSGTSADDSTVRDIAASDQLTTAIETCLEAATKEFDIVQQKRLLRASSYGMHFSYKNTEEKGIVQPSPTAIAFVSAARKLRVLNRLRHPSVGWIATSAQYDAMTSTGVVARLIALQRPSLACSISQYLGLPKSVQIFARASKAAAYAVAADGTDAQIAEAATQIIHGGAREDSLHRGAYSTVAMAANKAGRPGVANLLLLLETSVADKVPALLSTGAYADAMAVATQARDLDFIFNTLMDYERSCLSNSNDVSKAQAAFLGTVVAKFTPEGFHTLRRYLQTTSDVKSVTNLLIRAQQFASAGTAMAQRALHEQDTREKQGLLAEASRIFGLGKDTALHKASTDDYAELLRDQETLRTKHNSADVAPTSSSVTKTIASVIKYAAVQMRDQHRLFSDAEKLAKKYRVPEKRYWHIQVTALAESQQWSNLRILSESKTKSPIGYKPFARAAIRGKQSSAEILKYIDRVTATEERYDLFCEASLWKRALEEADKLKDARRVLNVKTLCNSNEIQLLADAVLGRLAQ